MNRTLQQAILPWLRAVPPLLSSWVLAVAWAGAALLALSAPSLFAAEPIAVRAEQPLRDPWVPPELRTPSTERPTEGAALRAQVERKLKQAFDTADIRQNGSLTRAQASAAGLGFVAQHFDDIDRQKAGVVRFDDVKRYLIEHGAQLD
jgi:hypothetical protein